MNYAALFRHSLCILPDISLNIPERRPEAAPAATS